MKRKLTQLGEAIRANEKGDLFALEKRKRKDRKGSAESTSSSSSEDESSDDEVLLEEEENPANSVSTSSKGNRAEKDAEILAARKRREEEKKNIVPYKNKQRVLIFSSRGVTSRFRHLNEDFRLLLPHGKKENKHDTKKNLYEINDLCEMKNCNNCIFFEARKSKDLFMWASKAPSGPSAKFHVTNIHTMEELRLTGNCLKGSRPLLSFSNQFDKTAHYRLIKELFIQAFGTPNGHPKSKPFVDHVMTFSILDGRIWFRHFQITDTTQDKKEISQSLKRGEETIKLVEIGPRFVLELVKIFSGGFGGQSLYENPKYLSPTKTKNLLLKSKGNRYNERKAAENERLHRQNNLTIPKDPLGDVFK